MQSLNSMLTEQLAATKASVVTTVREVNETHAKQIHALQTEVAHLRATSSTMVADKEAKIGTMLAIFTEL